jgi:hypothetical protein
VSMICIAACLGLSASLPTMEQSLYWSSKLATQILTWLVLLAGPPVVGLLQQVNQKLRLAQVFGRSWSAREARESPTPLQREGESLHPLGGITPLASQLPLADGSLGDASSLSGIQSDPNVHVVPPDLLV